MSDVLILTERIRNSILIGESDFREFKSALEGKPGNKKPRRVAKMCQDVSEALVAFANTDGGEILIGVEDDLSITGVPHSDEDINALLQAPFTHVYEGQELPMVYRLKVEIEGKIVLFFQVDKGLSEIFQLRDGRVMRRNEKRQTVPADVRQLEFGRNEIASREYDRKFVDGAKLSDLKLPLVQELADSYLSGLTMERYLQQLGLAQYTTTGLRLTRAALLLFAADIQRWHPRSQVRYIKVNGTELLSGDQYNVLSDEFVQGNIYELIFKAWEAMRPYLAYKTEFGTDGQFVQKFIYPEAACREAILNAIVHRDYNSSNGIEIVVFDDRLEIKSPGALLSTITIEDLEALDNRHESRNVKIALALKENKLMREMGEGMKRIFNLMQQNELQRPRLYSNTVWFTVSLYNKSVFTKEELKFINLFSNAELTPLQKRILVAGMNVEALSPADIHQAMNTFDRDTYDREVTQLRKQGILEQIRSNADAARIAKQEGIPKPEIPRFRIKKPD